MTWSTHRKALPPSRPKGTAQSAAGGAAAAWTSRLTSEQLFGSRRELEIEHGGSVYRLRQTATGKLILTK